MVLLKASYRRGAAVLLTLGLAAWTTTCTTLDDLTGPSCAFVLSSASAAFDSQGGTGTVAVHTANSCAWTVTTNDPWVVLTSATSGRGDGSIAYAVAPTNTGAPARSATLNVSGQSFTVSQSSASVCTYAAAPVAAQFPPAGGSGRITVTTADGCPWTATSQASWVRIPSGSRNGAGNGAVNYAVDENKSKNSRSTTVIVSGRTVTISQGAAPK